MRALTNSEKSYNNLLSRVSEIKFYVQTTCDRRDENYYNKLFLKALVEQDPYALNEYSKIQEIISMPKEERSKLLDYDENGELNIQKYGLSEHSKIYVLSRYLDIKELLSAMSEGVESFDENDRQLVGIIRTLIAEENTATASYLDKAKKIQELGYEDEAKVLFDIANEELVHASELTTLLVNRGLANDEETEKGIEEVEELLGE